MKISTLIGQFPITFNIEENFYNIRRMLDKSSKDDLVILPEGVLSGYDDDISFLKHIQLEKLNRAMVQIKQEVIGRKIHIIFG